VIDAQHMLAPGATTVPQAVAAAIAEAASTWGFFQLVNHSMPPTVLDRMAGAMQAFFDLPMEVKLQVRLAAPR
jgi:isopenicillin N synthase-like dioxygenase